eukprot:TRINITY_DN1025_c0_g1_i1.p1 TRINITY_DN1025_c0_g1~~TRINITY_DN1025_c0_g1_i1.p1  ORF type:complete len:278 (-),score=30.25 TRINITY_DN1025_c0_g1_i1:302-1135(-)
MTGNTSLAWLLGSYVLAIAVLSTTMAYFVWFEVRAHGISAVRSNRFVGISLMGNVCFLFDFILYIAYLLDMSAVGLFAFSNMGFGAGCCCHVTLVYLRSRSVFPSVSSKYSGWIQAVIMGFYASAAINAILNVTSKLMTPMSQPSSALYIATSISSLVSGVLFALVDIVSTIAFSRHVYSINKQLKKGMRTIRSLDKTELIARRGSVVCLCSSIGVLCFAIYWGVYHKEVVYLMVQFMMTITMVLWMIMKIELDRHSDRSLPESDAVLTPTTSSGQA